MTFVTLIFVFSAKRKCVYSLCTHLMQWFPTQLKYEHFCKFFTIADHYLISPPSFILLLIF